MGFNFYVLFYNCDSRYYDLIGKPGPGDYVLVKNVDIDQHFEVSDDKHFFYLRPITTEKCSRIFLK